VVVEDYAAGYFVLHSLFRLCLDRPGEIEVVDVAFERSEGGLRVDGFAVRPLLDPDGQLWPSPENQRQPLWEQGFQPDDTKVNAVCLTDDEEKARARLRSAEYRAALLDNPGQVVLGVQLAKLADDETVRGDTIRVTYESGGRTFVHRIPFTVVLCAVGTTLSDADIEDCESS
jgi:hypothetical protein